MEMSRNRIPKIGLALVLAFFAYCAVVVGDSGSVTGGPVEVLGIFGTALMFVAILATFATIYIAARRAHQAGSWLWFFGVIFMWPVSYLYTLAVNRHG
ncbi:hypothetical protein GCM10008101_28440 [Lysobacter xinjiangensis]|uniref:Uncharacterized protein n=1 Tax=Cognatilysobacter xinjiangensis TaxID=546892 RepID=A0ABQ3C8I2_9GAMM|nr:hypothetical protein [Lysobacter xinjiangensis]GGZ72340.1 hypothetical protein GCM10008101_28440 [Lysobacter xinjiangensis]